jgi:mycothiol synthase
MSSEPIEIVPIDIRAASTSAPEFAALATFANRMRAEHQPDDPPMTLEELVRGWQSVPPFVGLYSWVARRPGDAAVIANADFYFIRSEQNQHAAQFNLGVLTEHRRQGIGRRMLALIADAAARENRRLLISDTTERIPAGEAFLERAGAARGLEVHTNQLKIDELDRPTLQRWLNAARGLAGAFELVTWTGPYPEEQLAAVAALFDVMNQQPRGSLAVEDSHITPEQLRQAEQSQQAGGTQRWTIAARECASGMLTGFTEVFWNPNRPELLRQGDTGVFPQYRRRGLGRWLKAAMLDKVLRERPQVRLVRTGNADSNTAMLKINTELGFRPYTSQCIWQMETSALQAYLSRRATSPSTTTR